MQETHPPRQRGSRASVDTALSQSHLCETSSSLDEAQETTNGIEKHRETDSGLDMPRNAASGLEQHRVARGVLLGVVATQSRARLQCNNAASFLETEDWQRRNVLRAAIRPAPRSLDACGIGGWKVGEVGTAGSVNPLDADLATALARAKRFVCGPGASEAAICSLIDLVLLPFVLRPALGALDLRIEREAWAGRRVEGGRKTLAGIMDYVLSEARTGRSASAPPLSAPPSALTFAPLAAPPSALPFAPPAASRRFDADVPEMAAAVRVIVEAKQSDVCSLSGALLQGWLYALKVLAAAGSQSDAPRVLVVVASSWHKWAVCALHSRYPHRPLLGCEESIDVDAPDTEQLAVLQHVLRRGADPAVGGTAG